MLNEKQVFADNLNYYMELNGKTQSDLIIELGVNKSTISTWCNGSKMPRMGTIQTLADYFNIKKSDLIEQKTLSDKSENKKPAAQNDELSKFGNLTPANQKAIMNLIDNLLAAQSDS